MTRLLLSFAALLALMSVDALAGEKKLTGPEIKAAFSDAHTTFTPKFSSAIQNSPLFVVWKADGTMTLGDDGGYFQGEGKWWVKSDRFCRQWTSAFQRMPFGSPGSKEECFGVTLDGEKVNWRRVDGSEMNPDWSATFTK